MEGIAGKVALVTGASAGLGAQFARVLAGAGARVAIAARRVDRLAALAAELGGETLPVAIDVASVASIQAGAALVAEKLGPISILVNNAGISLTARVEAVTEAEYDGVMDTNLKGAFFMAQAVAKQMIAAKIAGRIVNIASITGQRTVGQLSVYGMSKAAMINTNAICPGYIATEMAAEFLPTEAGQRFVASMPRKRFGEAADLDALLLLLCSGEASRFINGSIVNADDGFTSF